jgi:hypothetical protein
MSCSTGLLTAAENAWIHRSDQISVTDLSKHLMERRRSRINNTVTMVAQ